MENLNNRLSSDGKTVLEVGMLVDVPEPNDTDIHSCSFVGSIISFVDDCAIVEDFDNDCFTIECNRLTVSE